MYFNTKAYEACFKDELKAKAPAAPTESPVEGMKTDDGVEASKEAEEVVEEVPEEVEDAPEAEEEDEPSDG